MLLSPVRCRLLYMSSHASGDKSPPPGPPSGGKVCLSACDWNVIVTGVRRATDIYGEDEIDDVVIMERAARRVVDAVESRR